MQWDIPPACRHSSRELLLFYSSCSLIWDLFHFLVFDRALESDEAYFRVGHLRIDGPLGGSDILESKLQGVTVTVV